MLNRIRNLFVKKPKGFSLVETLLFSGIISVVLLGTLRLMGISARSVKVNKISHVEAELEGLIREGIMNESDCIYNLGHTQLNGTPLQGMGTIANLRRPVSGGDILLFSTGQNIKDSLEIVKMEIAGTDNLVVSSGRPVERFFTVYYKKLGAGKLNTLGGGTHCSASNVRDCYFKTYKLTYRIDNIVFTGNTTTECAVSVCTQGMCCYTADRIDESLPITDPAANINGRSIIGCRGTSSISKSRTVGLGFMAGVNNTSGDSNIFMGYSAGYHDTTTSSPEGSRNIHIGAQLKRPSTPPPPDNTGYSNIFIGTYAGHGNTTGHQNIFFGFNSGKNNREGSNNTFIGLQTGFSYIAGEGNVFIGVSAGGEVGEVSDGNPPSPPLHGNTYIGHLAGHGRNIILNDPRLIALGIMPTTHSNIGEYNTFIGWTAGFQNSSGSHSIYIGRKAGHLKLPPDPTAGLSDAGDFQLNIGHLILGRIPDPQASPHPLSSSPDIPDTTDPDDAVVINGDLKVRDGIFLCNSDQNCPNYPTSPVTMNIDSKKSIMYAFNPTSSKVYKKNIKPFKKYEKALEDLVNTSLFTYEYKKDRPEKSRMGIISEELPKHLQLEEKIVIPAKAGIQKKAPMPDWPSIYGTFWASIKTLYIQLKNFKEEVLVELKEIQNILNRLLKITQGNKNQLIGLEAQVKKTVQVSKNNQIKNKQQKKQFIQFKKNLETTRAELQTVRQELQK